jgi:uncharacterized protein YutE (UPF0331/DUF86 family)
MDEKEKISIKIKAMEKYVNFLKLYKEITVEELEKDYKLKSAIERNFQLAIESALDIGEIIISAENLEKPEDYKSIIIILGKSGILPIKFSERFALAAGFRNILVHIYDEVGEDKLCEYLQNNLGDFNDFAKFVAKYLQKED